MKHEIHFLLPDHGICPCQFEATFNYELRTWEVEGNPQTLLEDPSGEPLNYEDMDQTSKELVDYRISEFLVSVTPTESEINEYFRDHRGDQLQQESADLR